MNKKILLLIAVWAFFGTASAEVISETLCYVGSNEKNQHKPLTLIIKKYLDDEIQQEIGAFAQYGSSKKIISLTYVDSETSDDLIDYELHWLEISGGKITGEYSLVKPKGATTLGSYIKYKNFKTRKETIFSPSGKMGADCIIDSEK